MNNKISDSELQVMNYLWKHGESKATDISIDVGADEGIDRNTVYTYIQRLYKKGYIKRRNPGFFCTAAADKDEIQKSETEKFVNKLFDGSFSALVKCVLENENLSETGIDEIKKLISEKNN